MFYRADQNQFSNNEIWRSDPDTKMVVADEERQERCLALLFNIPVLISIFGIRVNIGNCSICSLSPPRTRGNTTENFLLYQVIQHTWNYLNTSFILLLVLALGEGGQQMVHLRF